jgi:hypothetical protein
MIVIHLYDDPGIGFSGWGVIFRGSPLTSSCPMGLGIVVIYAHDDLGIDIIEWCVDHRQRMHGGPNLLRELDHPWEAP